jgi:hypothetical protein
MMMEKSLNVEHSFTLKIHLNQNSKPQGNLSALTILLESTHCVQLNEIYLEVFRPKG